MPDLTTIKRDAPGWALALLVAFAGGLVARAIGTPLPWMMGALLFVGIAAAMRLRVLGIGVGFPQQPRFVFVAIVGVMIGGTARPDMLDRAADWLPSLTAVAVFVFAALGMNYLIFRRIAGYDRPTAFYCAAPGGLIESVALGEAAGGNAALLAVQHFSRIAVTVTIVPILFWVTQGQVVGSAAGVQLTDHPVPLRLEDAALLGACALIGGWGGKRIGLPAAIITGPILLSASVHVMGWTEAHPPDWLIAMAQLVIGMSLALRFEGLSRRDVTRGIGFAALTVTAMLMLGGLLAFAMTAIEAQTSAVLFLCFAPGGLVEMGLIALSLDASPVFVSLHHFLRIVLTVMVSPLIWGRFVLPRHRAAAGPASEP